MTRLSAAEVFTPTSYPTYTYVPRDDLHHERLLRQWTQSSTQIASVSGPSKAGKTVLVQRVVGEGNLITVSGASVREPDQLWERVLDWYGEPHTTTASRGDTATDTKTSERGGTLAIAGTGASTRASTASANALSENMQATVHRRGLPQVVQELSGKQLTVLLDDFHYIPAAIQGDVAQQLKDAASRGVRICVASVPHRADNLVRALPELRGRVLAIDVEYWNRRDLLEIPRLGCERLGIHLDSASLAMFATEAAGSPQLMQSICLWTCNHLQVHEAVEPPRAVTLDNAARKQILFLTSCTVDFRSLVRSLIAGPKARPGERKKYVHRDGTEGDVYLTVMRAIAMDPPRLTLEYAELGRRLDELCKHTDPPDGASIVRTCVALGQIARSTESSIAAGTGPSLEWDERDQVLVLPDPYLLFYLRWSGILERSADGDN
ncbi:MAG: hypothetical protein H0X17_11915 [Deltaproteobacteria bacterium]|nr:hypothetical protein [Deltaproteobacteria bacterium]